MERTEPIKNSNNPRFQDDIYVPWNGRLEQSFKFDGPAQPFFCFFPAPTLTFAETVWDINGAWPMDKYAVALTRAKQAYIGSAELTARELLGLPASAKAVRRWGSRPSPGRFSV